MISDIWYPNTYKFQLSSCRFFNFFLFSSVLQLDISRPKYIDASKCLGDDSQRNYGIVCNEGVFRDGIQRNIEVVAVCGSLKGEVSLYPSSVLHKAIRNTVLIDEDIPLLSGAVKALTHEIGVASIDAEALVRDLGLGVWARLYDITRDVSPEALSRVVQSWKSFEGNRSQTWPHESFFDSDNALLSLAFKRAAHPATPPFWTCDGCKMDKNPAAKAACVMCKVKAPRWVCEACSTSNKVNIHFSSPLNKSTNAINSTGNYRCFLISFTSIVWICFRLVIGRAFPASLIKKSPRE